MPGMQVIEHRNLFSDVHTPIVLYLDLPENTNVVLPTFLVLERTFISLFQLILIG